MEADETSTMEDLHEYETQFFAFTPRSFVDSMFNITFETCWNHIQNLLEKVQQKFPGEMTAEQLNASADILQSSLAKTMDIGFDKLQVYLLTHLFRIPESVTLPEDNIQSNRCSAEDEARLDADIDQIQKKILATKYVNACLRSELEESSLVHKQYEMFSKRLNMADSSIRSMGVGELHEGLIFLNEQFNKLLPLLEDESLQTSTDVLTADSEGVLTPVMFDFR